MLRKPPAHSKKGRAPWCCPDPEHRGSSAAPGHLEGGEEAGPPDTMMPPYLPSSGLLPFLRQTGLFFSGWSYDL